MRPVRSAAVLALCLLGLPALLAACDAPPTTVVGTDGAISVSADSYEGRLDAALARVGGESLSLDGAQKLADLGGVLLADAPDRLSGLPDDLAAQPLLADPELRAALLGRDEAAVAALLVGRGVRSLVLHSDLALALDQDRRVLSRLYHHGHLDHFRLVRVGQGLLYYQVLEQPVRFSPQQADLSIQYLRARLRGQSVQGFPELESGTGEWTLFATLRGQGQELAVAFAREDKLDQALDELAEDLEAQHRRRVEILGFPRLAVHVDQLSIEVQRVVERAYVEPRDEQTLAELWELGLDGAYMMTPDRKERAAAPGALAYTRSILTADDFLRETARLGRMGEKRPWRDPAAWLELLRTVHYREEPGRGLVPLYRGVPPLPTRAVTLASTREAILSAGDWWLANMAADGSLNYKFWPHENRFSADYNHVRHTLATWNLVQAWRIDPERNPAYLEGARRALDWTNRYRKDEGDMTFYSYGDNQKLGSVVVNLMGMIDLARATGSREWDDLIRRQARFALFMQKDSGTFDGYYVPRGHPYHGQTNDIVPGEAALALVMVADYFDEDEWIATLPKFWEYYRPWFEARVSRRHDDKAWPRFIYDNSDRLELVQFGPWTVMAANAYHARTGDVAVAEFGLEVARWMIEAYMYDEDRAPFPDYVGGYYKIPTELPAMQAFCYAEGTAAAYAMALRMGRQEDARWFDQRTRETIRFGMLMQYDDLDSYAFSRPELVWGGIRYAMNETKVRVDYTYHGQSSFVQWYEAALQDPGLPAEVRDGPAGRSRPRKILQAEGRQAMPGYLGAQVSLVQPEEPEGEEQDGE